MTNHFFKSQHAKGRSGPSEQANDRPGGDPKDVVVVKESGREGPYEKIKFQGVLGFHNAERSTPTKVEGPKCEKGEGG